MVHGPGGSGEAAAVRPGEAAGGQGIPAVLGSRGAEGAAGVGDCRVVQRPGSSAGARDTAPVPLPCAPSPGARSVPASGWLLLMRSA